MNYFQEIYFTNLNAVYNFGGYFDLAEGEDWVCSCAKFDQNKFYYIVDGECFINIEGKEYHGKAGDWFFIPANTAHSYYNVNTKPFRKYWMHFDLYPDAKLFSMLKLPYVVKVDKGNVLSLFKAFTSALNGNKLTDKLAIKGCLINLVAEYIKISNADEVSVKSRSDARINDLLRFINENLDQPLSNDVLAEKYFAHPNHFIRAFRDKTGLTPAKYIRQKRMENAKRLLENTDLTISEITEKVGICDSAHFSRVFKEFYNMPPASYRQFFESEKKINSKKV